jgi:hypothetical protein
MIRIYQKVSGTCILEDFKEAVSHDKLRLAVFENKKT